MCLGANVAHYTQLDVSIGETIIMQNSFLATPIHDAEWVGLVCSESQLKRT